VLKYDVKERFVEENEQPVVEKERKNKTKGFRRTPSI
jgi:hypothetical protein